MDTSLQNRPARNGQRGLGIALLGLAMMAYPPVARLDGMAGGYALQTLGLFVLIVGVVTWAVYRALAVRFARILRGEGMLAHWTYSEQEWRDYTESEGRERADDLKALYVSVLFIAAIVCGVFGLTHDDAIPVMLLIWLGLAIVLGATAFVAARQGLWRNRHSHGEAIVSRLGVLLPAEEHFWGILGSRLMDATVDESPPTLTVTYMAPTRYGVEEYFARVRVPAGQEESAQQVATALLSEAI